MELLYQEKEKIKFKINCKGQQRAKQEVREKESLPFAKTFFKNTIN